MLLYFSHFLLQIKFRQYSDPDRSNSQFNWKYVTNYSLFCVHGKHVKYYMWNVDQISPAWQTVNQKEVCFVGYHLPSTDVNQNMNLTMYLLNTGLPWVAFSPLSEALNLLTHFLLSPNQIAFTKAQVCYAVGITWIVLHLLNVLWVKKSKYSVLCVGLFPTNSLESSTCYKSNR